MFLKGHTKVIFCLPDQVFEKMWNNSPVSQNFFSDKNMLTRQEMILKACAWETYIVCIWYAKHVLDLAGRFSLMMTIMMIMMSRKNPRLKQTFSPAGLELRTSRQWNQMLFAVLYPLGHRCHGSLWCSVLACIQPKLRKLIPLAIGIRILGQKCWRKWFDLYKSSCSLHSS